MKVLIIHCAYKFKGGEDTVVAEELQLLKNNSVDTELLLFTNDGNTLSKILQMPFNFSSYDKTLQKIKSFQPDVVHIHNLHFAASPSVIYAIRKTKTPFVCTLHNYRLICPSGILFFDGNPFLDSLKTSFPWQAIKKGVYRNSRVLTFWMALSMKFHHLAKIWQRCNSFIVLSNYAKHIFLDSKMNLRKEQLVVKPNFASIEKLSSSNRQDYFLYVGRLSEEKGIRILLRLFSSLTYTIKFAGDGPLKEEVIATCHKNSNMEYLGKLKKEELLPLLANCNALLFPSIWFEGMPLTIIEAFACSTAVIASRLGAMDDMIMPHYNGLHFEAGDEKSLRNAIEEWELLTNEQKKVYRQNARAAYENLYTPEKNAEQLLSIYRSVIKEKIVPLALATENL